MPSSQTSRQGGKGFAWNYADGRAADNVGKTVIRFRPKMLAVLAIRPTAPSHKLLIGRKQRHSFNAACFSDSATVHKRGEMYNDHDTILLARAAPPADGIGVLADETSDSEQIECHSAPY